MSATRSIDRRATFARLRRPDGRATRGPIRVAWVAPSPASPQVSAPFPQVGYTIGKHCGTAVARNRLRRRLRAAVAGCALDLAPGAYLIGSSPAAHHLSPADLARHLQAALAAVAGPAGGSAR